MLIAVATAAVMWLLAALYHVSLIDPLPVAVQAFLTIALYPVLSWLFARSARVLVQEAQA
jgi:Flp pilus assembly protein TadB